MAPYNTPETRPEIPADLPTHYFPAAVGLLLAAGFAMDIRMILTQDGAPLGKPKAAVVSPEGDTLPGRQAGSRKAEARRVD